MAAGNGAHPGTPGARDGAAAASAGPAKPLTLAGYQQAALAAVDGHDYVEYGRQIMGDQVIEHWTPLDRSAGAFRVRVSDRSGRTLGDLATRPAQGRPGAFEFVQYVGAVNQYATWTHQPQSPLAKPKPPASGADRQPPSSPRDWLRAALARADLKLVGPSTVDGVPAILLTYTEEAPDGSVAKHGKLWLDANTYLPLRRTVTFNGVETTIDYRHLELSTGQAKLWFEPEPTWVKVPADQLRRDLVR